MTGNNSIHKSQPTPRLYIVDRHVVADVVDIIKFFCFMAEADTFNDVPIISTCLGVPDSSENVSTYFESEAYRLEVKRILEEMAQCMDISYSEALFLFAFRLWSDSYDPDKCKDNRNGVWMLVLSFLFGKGEEVVFPVALGPKSDDHGPALRLALKLIDDFHNKDGYGTVCVGSVKRVARVKLNLSLYSSKSLFCNDTSILTIRSSNG